MPPQLVLTTCGTSALTNGATDEEHQSLLAFADASVDELTPNQAATLAARLRAARVPLSGDRAWSHTAELSSLAALLGRERLLSPARGAPDQHVLITTDSAQGAAAVELLRDWLTSHGHVVHTPVFGGLSTRDLASFQVAAGDLARWCDDTLAPLAAGARITFNVTGGLKSVSGFVQALGMLHADEIVSLFEGASELIRIPRLPLRIDATEAIRPALDPIRRLAAGLDLPLDEAAAIPELFRLALDDHVTMSPWGEVTWQHARATLYGERLLKPWAPKLTFTTAFERDARPYPTERLVLLNERIDDLCRFLETGHNPRRLRFHPISDDARPPSTHEAHIWTDLTARLYGHFEGDTFVLDALGRHL